MTDDENTIYIKQVSFLPENNAIISSVGVSATHGLPVNKKLTRAELIELLQNKKGLVIPDSNSNETSAPVILKNVHGQIFIQRFRGSLEKRDDLGDLPEVEIYIK